jgi:multidrug resistance efflux pump
MAATRRDDAKKGRETSEAARLSGEAVQTRATVTKRIEAATIQPAVPPPMEPRSVASVRTSDETSAALELLLRIEQMARGAADLAELHQVMTNETRKLNRARQIFVISLRERGSFKVVGASGVAVIDSHSTLAGAIGKLVATMAAEKGAADAVEFTLPAFCAADSELALAYPFREMVWLPLLDRHSVPFAGLLLARESIWTKDDIRITRRLTDAYAHAWRELATAKHFASRVRPRIKYGLMVAIAAMVALGVPVPMTALAPAEIVAATPFVVAAPIDAVVDEIAIEPGAAVRKGDVLVRFSDTVLRNRLAVAEREVAVAEARVKQATLLAFSDAKARHELGIAAAELDLKRAERDYAADLMQRSVLRAERDGLAVYADRKSLIGRPVSTGERIMEIADTAHVEVRIDLAAPDAAALEAQSPVKLFLDVDPLRPWSGAVTRSDYRARPSDADVLSFRTFATLERSTRELPRIGLRGTAQVYGASTPLGLYLFRRPLSSARQWLGL